MYKIKMYISGFKDNCPETVTLSPVSKSVDEQMKNLINSFSYKRIMICRFSDGEYTFLLGHKPPVLRNINFIMYLFKYFKYLFKKYFSNKIVASTRKGVSSGIYNLKKSQLVQNNINEYLINMSSNCIFALHLTYPKVPFQEKFHKSLFLYFDKLNIKLTEQNFIPFYAVYALFNDLSFINILKNKKLTIITCANDEKKTNIENYLFENFFFDSINWFSISQSNSLNDTLSESFEFSDFIFIGAGIGKINIFNQLININSTSHVIDVGYLLEYWSDQNNCYRPYLVKE